MAAHFDSLSRRSRETPEHPAPLQGVQEGSVDQKKIEAYDMAIVEVLGPDLKDTPFGREVRDIGRRIAPHFEN